MAKWSFWDWLTYICIWIAAVVLAVDQAIKGSPTMAQGLSGIINSPAWRYAPLMFMVMSGILLLVKQLSHLGSGSTEAANSTSKQSNADLRYIKTNVRLQFFGDHRIPHEVSSDNVCAWCAYFSASIQIHGPEGEVMFGSQPNWAIFLVLDKPASFRQAITSFSNPEVMPVIDTHMANSRAIVISTRGQIPAGVLEIHIAE